MSELSHIDINNVPYEIKDAYTRLAISRIEQSVSDEQQARQTTSIVGCFLDSTNKRLNFTNASGQVVAYVSTDTFLKDGMVSDVKVVGNYLLVSFNEDANKSPIRIPISDIFNSANYYTKTEVNSAISEEHAQLVAKSVYAAAYNSSTHRIEFKNQNNEILFYVDATPFIKDGMVSDVSIVNGNLVITFNTDSGKSPISIPLTSIFNPSNYYQKSEIDSKLAEKQSEISNLESKIGYYVCSSEASSASKTIAASNYVLGNGGSMKVKMANVNTANNATLNINSTGAKALYYDGERASATNSWKEGETVNVYYDGTNFYANNVAGGGKFATGEKVKEVGIDDEPTAGSDNLIKSGGVYNEVRPFIISGTTESTWKQIWNDANNPIPAGSIIENDGDLDVCVFDSMSTSQGSYNLVLIPANSSLTCEWAVYRIRNTDVVGSYSLKVHKNGTLEGRVTDLEEKVKFATGEQVSDVSIVNDLSGQTENAIPSAEAVNSKFEETDDTIQELSDELYGTSGILSTVVGSNYSYPARYTGEQSNAGYYRNYTVDLTGVYARGIRKVRFYGFSYTSNHNIVQGLIATGTDGNNNWIVESYIPPVEHQAGFCELPITANSTILVATIIDTDKYQELADMYPESVDVSYVPSTVTLISDEEGLKEQVQGLDARVTALEEDEIPPSSTLFATGERVPDVSIVNDLSGQTENAIPSAGVVKENFDNINTLLSGIESGALPTITYSSRKEPARNDGTIKNAGFFSRYKVNLAGAYAAGYRRVKFYGFSHVNTSNIVQGIVITDDSVEDVDAWSVESSTNNTAYYMADYVELPITSNSKWLIATILTSEGITFIGGNYPEGTILDFVPEDVALLSDPRGGIIDQIEDLDTRVAALEEGGGGGSTTAKFPATYMSKKVYGVIGDTLQIFRRSVVVSNDPYRQYLDFTCGQGKVYERYLEITPEKVSGVVPTNLTIKHRLIADDFSKSEEQISNLVLADRPSSSSTMNVLCIGASTTSNGEWASELKRRLTGTRDSGTPASDGLTNITFVGKKKLSVASGKRPVAVNVEATGGWRWVDFYTPQAAVRFTVSGVTSVDVGTVYSYTNANGQMVKVAVAEVNVTSGSGNIRFTYNYDTIGRGLPASASGTLTRVSSSGGDATIAYSSAEEETYCPFYDEQTEQPDFAHYASLYCDNQIDVLIAYMGNINEGIRGDSTDEKIAQVVNNMKTLLDAFHADFPNAKVIIGVAAVANPWYGYEEDYTAASPIKTWSLRYGLYRYVRAVETFLQGNDYKDWCYLANTHTEVDSESCYPTTTKLANTRTSRLDVIGSNGAHPNIEGYQMIADSMYRCFVNTVLQ